MSKPKISLLVPTMQQPWYLGITLASAMKNATVAEIEALVYSQKHGPETDTVIDQIAGAGGDVRIVKDSHRNEGVSVCVNECAKLATGDFLFYTGDDYYFLPGWDEALLRRAHPTAWLYLTPRTIEPTGTNPCMYAPYNFGRGPQDFQPSALETFWRALPKQDVVSCAGPPFLSREMWDAAGGFDETYWPGFGTDPDLAISLYMAAKEEGQEMKFLGVGDSGVYHYQCITTAGIRCPALTEASHIRFFSKWGMMTRDFAAMIGDGRAI